jgi:hypothetical protein
MVAKASVSTGAAAKSVEEAFFQNDQVSVCLLIHRRARAVRVVDFRAGPSLAKRQLVLTFAEREGLEKVYTLVERDEVATWVKLGFTREGNVPGFYKRSDAFFVGCVVPGTPANRDALRTPRQSEVRLSVARSPSSTHLSTHLMGADLDPALELTEDEPRLADSPAHQRMERTLVQAKKHAKALAVELTAGRHLPAVKLAPISEADTRKKVAAALKAGTALSGFEPFGRDVTRTHYALTARGHASASPETIASVETQSCFGSALVELLTGPTTEKERDHVTAALRTLLARLIAEDMGTVFSFVPSDDVLLATAYVANGFRRTGLLEQHLVARGPARGARKDAILFTRKLAPTD